jgi:hypothetical protein
MQIGGMLVGPTPPPPDHLADIDSEAADAAWRQSHGSLAAYHMLLQEHRDGAINLLSGGALRITPDDAPNVAPGDARFSATGGEVYGGEPGTAQVLPPGAGPQPEPEAEHVSPLSEAEREMLAELRAKPESELSAGDAANLRALSDREEALSGNGGEDTGGGNQRPLTARQRDRLATIREIPEGSRTPAQTTELAALEARENIER